MLFYRNRTKLIAHRVVAYWPFNPPPLSLLHSTVMPKKHTKLLLDVISITQLARWHEHGIVQQPERRRRFAFTECVGIYQTYTHIPRNVYYNSYMYTRTRANCSDQQLEHTFFVCVSFASFVCEIFELHCCGIMRRVCMWESYTSVNQIHICNMFRLCPIMRKVFGASGWRDADRGDRGKRSSHIRSSVQRNVRNEPRSSLITTYRTWPYAYHFMIAAALRMPLNAHYN